MRKFCKDIVSTLYASDGEMSLFRLTFAASFFVLMGIAIADFCCGDLTFDHYSECSLLVGSLGGLACGNKLIGGGNKNGHEGD